MHWGKRAKQNPPKTTLWGTKMVTVYNNKDHFPHISPGYRRGSISCLPCCCEVNHCSWLLITIQGSVSSRNQTLFRFLTLCDQLVVNHLGAFHTQVPPPPAINNDQSLKLIYFTQMAGFSMKCSHISRIWGFSVNWAFVTSRICICRKY